MAGLIAPRRPLEPLAVAVGLTALAVVYAGYALSRHAQYLTAGYDLGIFDQAVRAYSRLQAPVVPLKGEGFNLLGDHFHPVLVVLAPLYWLWDDPRVLLLSQSALVAASGWPVWRFTRRRLDAGPAALVLTAYALSWPLQGMIDFDFHEVAFAVPLVALAVDALDRGATLVLLAACGALLLVREDMGAFPVAVALVLALRRRWALAAGLAAAGLAATVVTTAVLIPALAPSGAFAYWTYDALGRTPGQALLHVVRHPLDTASMFVTPAVKWHTLLWLFAPTALLALLSPYVLLTLPFLAQRLLSSRVLLWTTEFHYSAVVAPVVVLAAVDGLARLPLGARTGRGWAAAAAAVVVVGTLLDQHHFPLGRMLTGAAFTRTPRAAQLEAALRVVPRGVCVAVDDRVAPHLTTRDHVSIARPDLGPATWLVLDLGQGLTGVDGTSPQVALRAAQARGFAAVTTQGPIVVLRRPGPVLPVCGRG